MASVNYSFCIDPVPVPRVRTKNREIRTGIPCPGTRDILEQLGRYESRSMHGQPPLVWDHAQDFNIYDACGNRFIDFASTIFVANVGHANPHVLAAVKNILDRPLVHNYAYATKIRAEYYRQLVEFAGANFGKAFLMSAGTEATEAAVKLMRLAARQKKKRRPVILSFLGNWHGRTMGAQMLSSNEHQKEWIGYQDPNNLYLPFPYPWSLNGKSGAEYFLDSFQELLRREQLDPRRDIAGFMLETFQGWAAAFYPVDFVQAVRKICDENDILLCFDEMQSGFARTGRAFGYEHYDVTADLLCCGKGMGGGFPISGVIGRSEIMDLPEIGDMSSTHSANPTVCAAGLAVLEEIKSKGLIQKATQQGNLLHTALNHLKDEFPEQISHVLGIGMIAALHFNHEGKPLCTFASRVAEECLRRGLLVVHTGRESIKIGPPLTIPDDALLEGVSVLREAIQGALQS